MSHKENDKYYEDLKEAEEELSDAEKALDNAIKDLTEAINWKEKMKLNFEQRLKKLQVIKDKE